MMESKTPSSKPQVTNTPSSKPQVTNTTPFIGDESTPFIGHERSPFIDEATPFIGDCDYSKSHLICFLSSHPTRQSLHEFLFLQDGLDLESKLVKNSLSLIFCEMSSTGQSMESGKSTPGPTTSTSTAKSTPGGPTASTSTAKSTLPPPRPSSPEKSSYTSSTGVKEWAEIVALQIMEKYKELKGKLNRISFVAKGTFTITLSTRFNH